MANKIKKAVFLTGAAARISQEVALFDKLVEKKGLTISQDDTILAGFSSGSLNLLALNGCFRNNNPLSWEKDYKEGVLFPLKDSDVFTKKKEKGLHILNTDPLRKTLNGFLGKQGVSWVADLPFQSYVMTFSYRRMKTQWVTNIAGEDNNLFLSDVFMASTAIPIVFPWQEIASKEGVKRDFPKGHFADGGTGGTFKRFEDHFGTYLQEQGAIEDLYIISPMRQSGTAEKEDETIVQALKDGDFGDDLKDKLKDFASSISYKTFFKFLEELQEWNAEHKLIGNVYVNIPRLPQNFGILDFNQEKEQYDAICNWVDVNPNDFCVPLATFIKNNPEEK
ncbi:MAG: hypothetical protein Crog4KO_01500 [Crocinitomicaceae bacterium]